MYSEFDHLHAALNHTDHAIARIERARDEIRWRLGPEADVTKANMIQRHLSAAVALLQLEIPVEMLD